MPRRLTVGPLKRNRSRQLPTDQLLTDQQLTNAEKEVIANAQREIGMKIAAKFKNFPTKQAQSALNLVRAFKTGDFSKDNLVLFAKLKVDLKLLIHDQLNMKERESFNTAMYDFELQRRNQ